MHLARSRHKEGVSSTGGDEHHSMCTQCVYAPRGRLPALHVVSNAGATKAPGERRSCSIQDEGVAPARRAGDSAHALQGLDSARGEHIIAVAMSEDMVASDAERIGVAVNREGEGVRRARADGTDAHLRQAFYLRLESEAIGMTKDIPCERAPEQCPQMSYGAASFLLVRLGGVKALRVQVATSVHEHSMLHGNSSHLVA
mmetsp:Transcript_6538/g.19380  ORF Transcript_6538/g.19380 Transcript_6538/m.19380 type:complete len:200 (+) Transcript_6538:703-1302(+)